MATAIVAEVPGADESLKQFGLWHAEDAQNVLSEPTPGIQDVPVRSEVTTAVDDKQLGLWSIVEAYDRRGQSMFGMEYAPSYSMFEIMRAQKLLQAKAAVAGSVITRMVTYPSLASYDERPGGNKERRLVKH